MGDPCERKLAHRVSAPVKVLGVVRPPAPSGGYCPKGNPSRAGGDAANSDSMSAAIFSRWRTAYHVALATRCETMIKPPRRATPPNWSRKLARVIVLDDGRQLRTLDDARAVIIEVYGSANVRFGVLNDVIRLLLTAAKKGKRDDIVAVTDAIERVTWREIARDVPQAALGPDATEQKSARGGP